MAYELCGDLERAIHAYREASTLTPGWLACSTWSSIPRSEAAMVRNRADIYQALQTCDTVLDLMAAEDAMAPPLGLAYAIRESRSGANRICSKPLKPAAGGHRALRTPSSSTDDLRHEYLFLAGLRCAQGKYAHAHSALQQVDALLQEYGIARLSDIVEAWIACASGWPRGGWRLPHAAAESYVSRTATEYRRDFEELTLAHVWLASARTGAAVTLLERVCAEAERGGWAGCVMEELCAARPGPCAR